MSGAATAVVITATVASAAISAYGAEQQGKAEAGAARYNSEVAANNAKIATQNSAYAGAEGEANTAAAELKSRANVGAIMASEASSGVDVNSGSAVDVRSSAAETGELNAINIRADAARKAYGYQVEGAADTGQSALDTTQASNDESAGNINAASSIIGGLGKAGGDYEQYGAGSGLNSSSDGNSVTDIATD